jgi:hypothetical protein
MASVSRETAGTSKSEPFLGEFLRVIALTILPVPLFAIAVAVILTDRQRSLVLETLERRTEAAATELDRVFGRQIALLTTLAGFRSLDTGDLPGFYIEAQRAAQTQSDWFTIILSDSANGQQVLNLLRPLGAPLPVFPDLDSHRQVVRTGKPMIDARPNARGPVSDRPVFGIRVPVLREGRAIYVLSAGLKPETIERVLERLELPPNWGGAIIDDKGMIVACRGSRETNVGQPVQPTVMEHIADEQMGVGLVTGLSGIESYFAIGRAPLSGWAVGARVPVADVTRLWLEELWIIGLARLISVLVALGALAWLTQRRRAGQQLLESRVRERTVALERALAERNLLLREVYHRVKNNLQIVNSLVSFQASRMTDAESRSGMDDLRHRVHAFGLVHQQLMNSTNLATFDIRPFLVELCDNLATSAGPDQHCIGPCRRTCRNAQADSHPHGCSAERNRGWRGCRH